MPVVGSDAGGGTDAGDSGDDSGADAMFLSGGSVDDGPLDYYVPILKYHNRITANLTPKDIFLWRSKSKGLCYRSEDADEQSSEKACVLWWKGGAGAWDGADAERAAELLWQPWWWQAGAVRAVSRILWRVVKRREFNI